MGDHGAKIMNSPNNKRNKKTVVVHTSTACFGVPKLESTIHKDVNGKALKYREQSPSCQTQL